MDWIKIIGYCLSLGIMMTILILAVVNHGALIYFYEPNPLVLISEIMLLILSSAVLIKEIYGDVKNA